ncbi:rhodanese-like domain-containing protein [Bacteroidota bacterium]
MKKFAKLLFLVLIATSVAFVGCNRDDDDDNGSGTPTPTPTPSFEILKTYVTSNSLDLDAILNGWIIDAAGVNAKGADQYFIIDIRGANDFAAGHIANAVNSTLPEVLTHAATATKPILVVCASGQTAGQAVVALRLSGYADAKVLKWGMAGWNSAYAGIWTNNTGDAAIGNASWVPVPGQNAATGTFTDPSFTSTFTDGAALLEERVDMLLNRATPWGVANTAVLTSPANYFINNYWADADVVLYGNITGAYRINPFTFGDGTYLGLDASKTIVTYCWTGQTSSMITAYLYVMGYDAVSLKFGANGMIYTNLQSHKYSVPATEYPVVP